MAAATIKETSLKKLSLVWKKEPTGWESIIGRQSVALQPVFCPKIFDSQNLRGSSFFDKGIHSWECSSAKRNCQNYLLAEQQRLLVSII